MRIVNNIGCLLILLLLQLMINAWHYVYIDLMAVVLIELLLKKHKLWVQLIIGSFIGDLYINIAFGSHLLVVLIIEIITTRILTFYMICNVSMRYLISTICLLCFYLVLYLINLEYGYQLDIMSVILQICIVVPLVKYLINIFLINHHTEPWIDA